MSFFILKINPDLDEEYLGMLNHMLASSPTGIPLDLGQHIYSTSLYELNPLWCVYWLDSEHITDYNIRLIKHTKGIDDFVEITDLTITIYDPEWSFDDEYVDSIFTKYLSSE